MGTLAISLLGPPRAELDGASVEVDTRKALALLAYLSIEDGPVARETLAAILWPESDSSRAHSALRRTLSTLRTALRGSFLVTDRSTVSLDRSAVTIDVEQFRALASSEESDDLERSVAVFRDDFLSGFSLRDSAEFDDWQTRAGSALRSELASVIERLVQAHAGAGRFNKAIEFAKRWLGLDPINERAHAELIRLYAANGDRGSAVRQYRECVSVLDAELGVAPLPETTDLYHSVLEHRASTPPERRPPVPARPPPLPMVGREDELSALAALHDVVGPDGRLAVCEGEAGIGKTRLVDEFLSSAGVRAARLITVRSHPEEAAIPYGIVADILRAAASHPPSLKDVPGTMLAEAGRLVPGLGDAAALPPLEGPAAQTRFFESILQILDVAPRGGVLFLDDLGNADDASVDALTYVFRRLEGRPILIVAAWRTEDVPAGHRLRQVAIELERAGCASLIRLGRLGPQHVADLAPDAAVAERLYAETEGVPLFVAEYLEALATKGDDAWSIPGGVQQLLGTRLAAASETARQVLSAAAVVGRAFDAEVARRVSGRSEEETAGALDELSRRGLVAETDGSYDFRHSKLQEVAYSQTGLARRRLLHRRAAEALVAHARERRETVPFAMVANHLRIGGRDDEAAEQFRLAGARARALYANADAAAHFETALALGHPGTGALHESLGDVKKLMGDYRGALHSYETAAATAVTSDLARLEHKLGEVHLRRGDAELARTHLEAAKSATGDDAARARVLSDLGLAWHRSGNPEEAARLAREAVATADAAGDAAALAGAHNILGMLLFRAGHNSEARNHLDRALSGGATLDDPAARIAALNNLALVMGAEGEIEGALSSARGALALCEAQGDRHRAAALHNNIGDLLYASGNREEAESHQLQAAKIFAEVGEPGQLQPEIWKLVEW